MGKVGPKKVVEKRQRVIVASRGKEGRNPVLNVVEIPIGGGEYDELLQTYDLVIPMFNPSIFEEVNTPELISMLSSLAIGIESGSFPPHEGVEEWLAQFPQQYLQTISVGGEEEEGPEEGEESFEGEEDEKIFAEGVSEDSYSAGFMDGLNYGVSLTQDNMMLVFDMVERIRGSAPSPNNPPPKNNRTVIAEMLRKVR